MTKHNKITIKKLLDGAELLSADIEDLMIDTRKAGNLDLAKRLDTAHRAMYDVIHALGEVDGPGDETMVR